MPLCTHPYATVPMVPGPTSLHPAAMAALAQDYGSGFLEETYLPLYNETCQGIARLLGTSNQVCLMTGEPMVALWGALKSAIRPGETVLCIGTGPFGYWMEGMVQSVGGIAHMVAFPEQSTINLPGYLEQIEQAILKHKPKMISVVHCETPCGTLNPLEELGALKKRLGVPLLYVDAVSSVGGTPVHMDAWNIDFLLTGGQKCLSAPASVTAVGVSSAAWEIARTVGYQGYDALRPFENVGTTGAFPYTPDWHGTAATHAAVNALLAEGVENTFARHAQVAARCRAGLEELGISLFPLEGAVPSPTVTAAFMPKGKTWPAWQKELRAKGLVITDTVGAYQGKVFRLGHMGTQADNALMEQALGIIASTL